jgi:hypothetical protein
VFFKEKTEKAKVQVRSFVSQEKKTFIQVGSQVFLKKKHQSLRPTTKLSFLKGKREIAKPSFFFPKIAKLLIKYEAFIF